MITAFFSRLWSRVWPYLAGVGAIIGAAVAIRQSGKRAGREQVERERLEFNNEAMKNAIKARDEFRQMDADAARDRAKRRLRESSKR